MGRIPGGPADPPAAGTNVAGSHTTIGTFVPAAGEAAGPPIQSREILTLRCRFVEFWRAGGPAGRRYECRGFTHNNRNVCTRGRRGRRPSNGGLVFF
jgi:hypothetical protein